MKLFLSKIFFFAFFLICALYAYILTFEYLHYSKSIKKRIFNNNLFYIPDKENFDYVFLGSSRAVPLDKWSNNDTINKYLKIKAINLANQGGGLLNQKIYLSYFFTKKNKTKRIIYFIDPFVINSSFFDYETMFNKEPFRISFLMEMIKCGANSNMLINYITSKLSFNPFINRINNENFKKHRVTDNEIRQRIAYLYRIKDRSKIEEQKEKILKILDIAKANKTEVVFILLPTLLGKELAYDDIMKFLSYLKKNKCYDYYDFSNTMQDASFFRDTDHLNSKGVSFFFRTYLQTTLHSIQECRKSTN
jgi:hypothetical protein